jgi:hypothetical protein
MNLQEIMDTCNDWPQFCQLKGFCVYSVNEGGGDVDVELTIQEAHALGIVTLPDWKVEFRGV